jgi:RNA polymerase sigma factor (TIGR02999 family)
MAEKGRRGGDFLSPESNSPPRTVMTPPSTADITTLLRAWSHGDNDAMEALMPLVYAELHRTAQRYMARENCAHTLQTTGLINETYLRLCKLEGVDWQSRGHFYAICARMMRRILTDYARSRPRAEGGRQPRYIPLDEAEPELPMEMDFVALDDALNALAAIDERQSQVVQLRFFVGLSVKEAADVLGVSERTVKQDWTFAKLWLLRELSK